MNEWWWSENRGFPYIPWFHVGLHVGSDEIAAVRRQMATTPARWKRTISPFRPPSLNMTPLFKAAAPEKQVAGGSELLNLWHGLTIHKPQYKKNGVEFCYLSYCVLLILCVCQARIAAWNTPRGDSCRSPVSWGKLTVWHNMTIQENGNGTV